MPNCLQLASGLAATDGVECEEVQSLVVGLVAGINSAEVVKVVTVMNHTCVR